MKKTIVGLVGLLFLSIPVTALAQPSGGSRAPAFCFAEDPSDPEWDINDYVPSRDFDDWCKLAHHEPHRAKRQLSHAVRLVRATNNANRYYFDSRRGEPRAEYIQMLRPWMEEQNKSGARWRVVQQSIHAALSYTTGNRVFARIADLATGAGDSRFFTVELASVNLIDDSARPHWDGKLNRSEVGYFKVAVNTESSTARDWICELENDEGSVITAEEAKAAVESYIDHLAFEMHLGVSNPPVVGDACRPLYGG